MNGYVEDFIIYKITNLSQVKDPVNVGQKKGFFYISKKYLVLIFYVAENTEKPLPTVHISNLVSDSGLEPLLWKDESSIRRQIFLDFELSKYASNSQKHLHKLLVKPSIEVLCENLKNEAFVYREDYFNLFQYELVPKDVIYHNVYYSLMLEAIGYLTNFIADTVEKLDSFLQVSGNEISRGIKMENILNEAKSKLDEGINPCFEICKLLVSHKYGK